MLTKLLFAIFGCLCVSLPATARMHLSSDSVGQILIFPYYTALGGYDTALSVINHSAEFKAVRIRFRESQNGRTVHQLNLLMSPSDMWTGVVARDLSTGGAKLISRDNTCAAPVFNAGGNLFSTAQLTERDQDGDRIDMSNERTASGYVEVFEMGTITNQLIKNAVQLTRGKAEDCPTAITALYSPDFSSSLLQDTAVFSPPTGSISGVGTLINVAQGTSYNYNAVSVAGAFTSAQHFAPTSVRPSLNDVAKDIAFFSSSARWEAEFARGIDAFSALLTRSNVRAEWVNDPSIAGGTDLILTFPTKFAYTLECGFLADFPFVNTGFCANRAPERFSEYTYDREERTYLPQIDFIQPYVPPTTAAGAAAIVTIDNSFVFQKSVVTQNLKPPIGRAGHLQLSFNNAFERRLTSLPSAKRNGVACGTLFALGLPIVGISVQKYVNGNVNGVLSNYGASFDLVYDRSVFCSFQ
jgi:hypothetical protein